VDKSAIACTHAFGVSSEKIGEITILMERDRTEQYKGAFEQVLHELRDGVYTGITGLLYGAQVSAIYSKSPADIADCVAFLGMAKTRCHTIFSTGSIGGLGEQVKMGDFVLATDAIGNDGYSQFIAKRNGVAVTGYFDNVVRPSDMARSIVQDAVAKAARQYGVRAHAGRVFTIPGVSLEDDTFLREIIAHGCIAIDMETAPFYAACRQWAFECAAFHWVTDLPLTRSFFHRVSSPTEVQADWDLKGPIWLNMARIVTAIVRSYVVARKRHGRIEHGLRTS